MAACGAINSNSVFFTGHAILPEAHLTSIKSLEVSFASLDILTLLKSRYGIEFKEILSDNGSEFSSRRGDKGHRPFEKLLQFLNITHRYTRPCRPQTNGKIERFWRTLEDELLSGETFDTLEEFRHYIRGCGTALPPVVG